MIPSPAEDFRQRSIVLPGALTFLVYGILCSSAECRTWHVEVDGTSDAPTIQAAIDSSASGDTVLIHTGTYQENLETKGKGLFLRGSSTPETTILDGGQNGRRALSLDSGGGVESLTIRNGWTSQDFLDQADGGGIRIVGPGPCVIRGCIIEGNQAEFRGGGIYLDDNVVHEVMIERNIVRENAAGTGGGIQIVSNIQGTSPVFIRKNIIHGNFALEHGGGILFRDGFVSWNIITRNTASISAGAVAWLPGDDELAHNTIAYNTVHNTGSTGAGVSVSGGGGVVTNNLIVGNQGGPTTTNGSGIECFGGVVSCNVLWGNDVDLNDCARSPMNRQENPQFCAVDPLAAMSYLIQEDSPCTPDHSGGCGLVGAEPVGCGTTATQERSWSDVKILYR